MRASQLHTHPAPHGMDLRRAWSWLIAVPFALVVGFVGGDLVIEALGYDVTHPDGVPLAATLLAGVPATLLMMAPGLLAYFFGMRAHYEGDSRALFPAFVGGVIAAFVLVGAIDGLLAAC